MTEGTRTIFEDSNKQKLFETTLKSINKDYGLNGSQVMGDAKIAKIERVSSGSHKIDELIGGGYPKGRIIEIFGPESSGKTTVALHHVAEHQKIGNLAVYIDSENALDLSYAERIGVNVKNLILAQPDTAEDSLQIAERWIQSGLVSVVVIDSVASLIPKAEMEGDIGDNHIGLIARLLSQALRKLAWLCGKTGTTMIFINQIREKVGVMFGNPETTPGGRALKFYSSIRIDIRPKEITKREGLAVSRKSKIKIVKSKVSPAFREDEVDITFGEGISKTSELLDFGVMLGIIQKSGNWYSYNEDRLGNGREASKEMLKENIQLFTEIDDKIREYLAPSDDEYEEEEINLEEKLPEEIVLEQ